MKSLGNAWAAISGLLSASYVLFHRLDPLLANFSVPEAYINFKVGRQFVVQCTFYTTRAFAQSSTTLKLEIVLTRTGATS